MKDGDNLYRQIVETALEGIWVIDKDSNTTFVNPAMAQMLGYGVEEMLGQSVFGFMDEEEKKKALLNVERRRRGIMESTDFKYQRKDGSALWTVVHSVPRFDADGRYAGTLAMVADVTEERETELLFETILQSSIDGFWITNLQGRFLEANDAYCRLIGYGREELLAMSISDIEAVENPQEVSEHIERLLRAGGDRFETRHRCKDGRFVDIEVSTNYLPKEGGMLVAFLRDITQRKQSEQALRESEERFRMTFDSAAIGMCLTGTDGRFLAANNALCAMLGYSLDELRQRHFAELTHPDDVARSQDWVRRMLGGESAERSIRNRYLEKNGRTIHAEVSASLFRAPDGTPRYFITEIQDVTERMLFEEKLKESEEKYRGLYESIADGILRYDMEGRIQECNQALRDMLGYAKEEILGLPYRRLTPERWQEADDAILKDQIMPRGYSDLYEKEYLKKNGEALPINIRKWLIRDPQGRPEGMWAIARDISERKRAERRRKQLLVEWVRSNAEIEQFNHLIAHDLQEPLRMVSSYLQLLAKTCKGKLDPAADEFIGFALEGSQRMQGMVEDLLSYSRIGERPAQRRDVDMEEALGKALANLKMAIEESGAVVTRGALPGIKGDPSHLLHLFQNLIGNALKFKGPEAPRIDIRAQEAENEVVFSVADNGIGIAPEFSERIFKIFQRLHTREKYPGHGVGLAFCRKIVEAHGGRIWVESALGQGAKFYFTIPKRGEKDARESVSD